MKRARYFLLCFLALAGLAFGRQACAEEYVAPTYGNLVKMLIRFGAVDLKDNDALNSYALLFECKLYSQFYRDEFRWHDFQKALRRSVQQDIVTFPTSLRYLATLQLDRYNFKDHIYSFTPKTSPKNVNLFTLDASRSAYCDDKGMNVFPLAFRLVLDQPLTIAGLPFSEEEGKVLLKRMEDNGNKDRLIYTQFNMRVIYIAPLTRAVDKATGKPRGGYNQERSGGNVRLDAHLASIDFYEDEGRTKLIYSYRP